MNTKFNELEWHDAIIQSIYIDRENPGEKDTVKLAIVWPDRQTSTIDFFDCYGLTMNMNFGFIALESILYAKCLDDSPELTSLYEFWNTMNINVKNYGNIQHYIINTNTTNSLIQIFARGFEITYGPYLPEEEDPFPDVKENPIDDNL